MAGADGVLGIIRTEGRTEGEMDRGAGRVSMIKREVAERAEGTFCFVKRCTIQSGIDEMRC